MVTISSEPALALQPSFGFVLLALVFIVVAHHLYMPLTVNQCRKRYGIEYPALYAAEGQAGGREFNCIQRGHQNSLEIEPHMLVLLFVTGLRFPVTAAAAGLAFNIGRILYFTGYSTGEPAKRLRGVMLYFPSQVVVYGMAVRWGLELLTHVR